MLVPCQLIRGDCLYQIHSVADEIFFIVSDIALWPFDGLALRSTILRGPYRGLVLFCLPG